MSGVSTIRAIARTVHWKTASAAIAPGIHENPGIESMASIGSMRNDHFRGAQPLR
jgi:hypothetical protein